jgi:hypothetical protein
MMSRVLDQFDLPVSIKPVHKRRAERRTDFFQRGFCQASRLRRLTVLVALLIGAATAFGESAVKPAGPVRFDIPAEPLVEALQAYSLQSGVQVMFETASATGYQSAPIEGDFAPEVALRRPVFRSSRHRDNVKAGSSAALACLNQQLQGKVDSVNPGTPTAPIDAKSSDLKVGTVNLSAVKQQYGKNYGVSVVPYRPNLVPGAPRLGR